MKRNEIIVLFVSGIVLAVVLLFALLKHLVDTAQSIQIIISFVLVMVTYIYVKRTSDIASATKYQAAASIKMAEEMREQRYSEKLPLLVPTIPPILSADEL